MITKKDKVRFWSYVDKSTLCWNWRGTITQYGYAQFRAGSESYRAHRLSYLWAKGIIPKGLVLDHLCRNRNCVNPEHLEAVTIKVNILRGVGFAAKNSKKTHCPEGHEYTPDNVYLDKTKRRHCKICHAERQREYLLRKKS